MTLIAAPPAALEGVQARDELRARIRQLQSGRLSEGSQPLQAGLEALLPDGLRAGAAYSIAAGAGATSLALCLIAGPSTRGVWCGVAGLPHLSTEAAASHGVELARLALVPRPGDHLLTVAAALADVLGIVVLDARTRVTPADANRLAARLRQKGSTLIALGAWPHAEATLRLASESWRGLGAGHGHLSGRRMLVDVDDRGGRTRRVTLELGSPGLPVAQPLTSPLAGTLTGPLTGGERQQFAPARLRGVAG